MLPWGLVDNRPFLRCLHGLSRALLRCDRREDAAAALRRLLRLMARYFDAHLYFANWGTHRLMLRIPKARVDLTALKPYFVGGHAARLTSTGEHVLLDLGSDTEEPEYDEQSQGSLAALSPLRSELMRGDLRPAYLAWLLAVSADDLDRRRGAAGAHWARRADRGAGGDGRVPAHRRRHPGGRCERERCRNSGRSAASPMARGPVGQEEGRVAAARHG